MKKKLSERFLSLSNDEKVLIIGGPTASGKTSLGIELAAKHQGELVSADSRQIYIGMDIGTGKDVGGSEFVCAEKELKKKIEEKINKQIQVGKYLVDGVPVWGLDLIKPDQDFSVAQWVEFAKIVIADIQARGKLAIVVGGTGFWIKALLTGIEWGRVPPDWELRKELENLSVEKLQQRLQQHAEKFWKEMTPSDWQNPRRLMRRIEVAEFLQDHTEEEATLTALDEGIIQEKIYLDFPLKRVNQNITKRVKKRLKQGLAAEIKQLLENGYSFTDPGLNTLGYKQFAGYFKGEKQLDQVVAEWKKDEQDYARRQQVWFDKYFNTKLD